MTTLQSLAQNEIDVNMNSVTAKPRSLQDTLHGLRQYKRLLATGRFHPGYCTICENKTLFVKTGMWLRDDYRCFYCHSIPRMRAFTSVLETVCPDWRDKRIHESSPDGASSNKLARECSNYLATQFYPDAAPGSIVNGVRCENLERLTFADATFDLVVTQDVFEHVLDPGPAFAEIARTLKPEGMHLFTVPYYYWKETLVRAVNSKEGVEYLQPPDYHGNPIDENGSLVVTEWGPDLCDVIFRHSGMMTTIHQIRDRNLGIAGKFLEVFMSRKPLASETLSHY